MNPKHIAEVLRDDFTTLVIQFPDKSMWTYKVLREDVSKYKVGGYALVPHANQSAQPKATSAPFNIQNQPTEELDQRNATFPYVKAGIVTSIHADPDVDTEADFDYKWIVAPLDMEPFLANLEKDRAITAEFQRLRNNSVRKQVQQALVGENDELKKLLGRS